jgi:hypothetical protein
VDTVDRSSTGIQNPPLIPVDGNDSVGGVKRTNDTFHQRASAPHLSQPPAASLGVTPPLKADGGTSLEISADEKRTPATPDLNWLIALGER